MSARERKAIPSTFTLSLTAASLCGIGCLFAALFFGTAVEVAFGLGALFGVLACNAAIWLVTS